MTTTTSYYEALAQALDAKARCEEAGNTFNLKWAALIAKLCDQLPSGGGFDNGTTLDVEKSNIRRLVFRTSFHHMDENGFYDGWTDHTVTVSRDFSGLYIKVSGRDRNMIKDYIAEVFHALDDAKHPTLADIA